MSQKKILIVGPLPPPVAGPTNSFELFCEEIKTYEEFDVEIVDTSAKKLKQKTRWISFITWKRGLRIFYHFLLKVLGREAILIFSTDGFLISVTPWLVIVSKVLKKRCYIRTFAGGLDEYYRRLSKPLKYIFDKTITHTDNLIVQTKNLSDFFQQIYGNKVINVPNFRKLPFDLKEKTRPPIISRDELKLIYISVIKKEKGIFHLLDGVECLINEGYKIKCGIYGPIHEKDKVQFYKRISEVDAADYKGIVDFSEVLPTISNYHVLVLPTYHHGEGHPGVIIEAMMVGIPVITTDFRSIPELVDHKHNGLLIKTNDTQSLIEAIMTIYYDRELLIRMGENNYDRRKMFDVKEVIPNMMKEIDLISANSLNLI
ncbi:MAG: glycosyltransferase family 4 protein [Candidatus Thorarchaeota archaeon]|jgi:glycosyltransferase involved in cell wall biosynthesis